MTLFHKNNKPFVEGVCLNDLTDSIETPFYIYSQKSITDAYNKLKKSLNAEIFYAVKANSNQAIISLMNSLGAGADVVSSGELKRALKASVNPKNIIFEGVGKSVQDLEYAVSKNIRQINVESFEELSTLNNIGKTLNKKINIGIRLNPNIVANTLDKISTGRKKDKFGINFDSIDDICNLVKKNKYINLIGISCHIGSQISELGIYKKVFNKMKMASEIIKKNNISLSYIDLGGGFFVDYMNEKEINLDKLSLLIKKIFAESEYQISFEPGRYLVAKSGILVTKIVTTKTNGNINFLITDAGMQSFLRPALYNAFHRIIPFKQGKKLKKYTIAGPICESSDVFAKNINLPDLKTGDFVAIKHTGAYGFVMASNYNTRGLPAEVLISNKKYCIIRKNEKISSVINKDIIPKWLNTN